MINFYKKALCLLCLFVAIHSASAQAFSFNDPAWIAPLDTTGATYLLQENFENVSVGYENIWTQAGSATTLDAKSTTSPAPLQGAQSLAITLAAQTGRTTNVLSSAYGTLDYYFLLDPVSIPAGARPIWACRDSAGNLIGSVQLNSDGTLRASAGGGTGQNTTDALSALTTYHVFITASKGTGANGVCTVGFSTDGTRPTSGNKFKSSSNGTMTTDQDRSIFGSFSAASTTVSFVVDKYRISSTTIGDNPQ
jgi:hypothetical protein